jgi:hypothetical protein
LYEVRNLLPVARIATDLLLEFTARPPMYWCHRQVESVR